MEKRKPHYPLSEIQSVVKAKGVDAFTATALIGATSLGLNQKDLYKSMTTHADHAIWQDVYHATLKAGMVAYIKVTLRESGAVVIQFKEK